MFPRVFDAGGFNSNSFISGLVEAAGYEWFPLEEIEEPGPNQYKVPGRYGSGSAGVFQKATAASCVAAERNFGTVSLVFAGVGRKGGKQAVKLRTV